MALSLNDVIMLAQAGFSKTDIAAFMNLGSPQTTPPSPVQVPGAPAAPTAPVTVPTPTPAQQAPATPAVDPWDAIAKQIEALVDKIDANKPVPSAGSVGALPTVTSVEDIILGAVKPAPAPESPSFNMEGVTK